MACIVITTIMAGAMITGAGDLSVSSRGTITGMAIIAITGVRLS
ncbi:MAG: hypothetical protein ACTHM2_13290 [Afipia sp.]|jgi:hypothetical protein